MKARLRHVIASSLVKPRWRSSGTGAGRVVKAVHRQGGATIEAPRVE